MAVAFKTLNYIRPCTLYDVGTVKITYQSTQYCNTEKNIGTVDQSSRRVINVK